MKRVRILGVLISGIVMVLASIAVYGADGYIDTHAHLKGLYKKESGASLKGQSKRRSRSKGMVKDYASAAKRLIEDMDRYNVEKAIVMPPPQIEGQKMTVGYQDLLTAVNKYPDRLALAAGGDILNPMIHKYKPSQVNKRIMAEFEKKAEMLVSKGIKAFGEMTAIHFSFKPSHIYAEAQPDHPLFLLLADIAAKHNIPIDLHMEAVPEDMKMPPGFNRVSKNNPKNISENITGLENLLEHNDDAIVVWQHIGWDNAGHMTIGLLRRLLARHDNLYLALRVEDRLFTMAKTPMPNRIVDKNGKIDYKWLQFIEDYPERFMIGTDEFSGIKGKEGPQDPPQSFDETWSFLSQLSPELAKEIGRDNAVRVYNLD